MTIATILQLKGQPPQMVNVADVSGILTQITNTVVILYRLWLARVAKMSTMELIGLAIALALMR